MPMCLVEAWSTGNFPFFVNSGWWGKYGPHGSTLIEEPVQERSRKLTPKHEDAAPCDSLVRTRGPASSPFYPSP
jgi:hypothetical protein